MSKVLTDCIAMTRTYLDEAAEADFTDQEVQRAINVGYHSTVSAVIEVYEDYYDTTTPFSYSLVSGTQEYLIDPSLLKVTRVEVNYQPNMANSKPIRLSAITKNESLIQLSSLSQGSIYTAGYYLHGRLDAQYLGLIPVPQETDPVGTKSISIWGVALPTDLVVPTDSVLLPYADRFYFLPCLEAASILMSKGQQSETASTKYHDQFLREKQSLQQLLRDRQADGPRMIEDSEIQNMDFTNVNGIVY